MANQKYKIVYCAPALYSAGGVERIVSVKASYFADVLGHDVTVILTEGSGRPPFFHVSPRVRVVNLQLDFEELWGASFFRKILLYVRKQHRYRQLLRAQLLQLQPDFTISVLRREINFLNDISDGSYKIGELHVNRANYRNFSVAHPGLAKRLFARYWMQSLVRHLKKLDRMVVLTETSKADWPELTNLCVIADPLPFRVPVPSPLTARRIVSIGRYVYEKGNDLLLQAWSIVEKQATDWVLDVYGMGNRQPYVELVHRLGIDDSRCRLHGCLDRVSEAYLGSSLFVLPSRFEGFGLVIIEAMACGLPVVSFDCENGPRSILRQGESGFLVEPFDVCQLADRMLQLIGDEPLRRAMGQAARRASARYDIDDIGAQWQHLFNEIARRP